MQARVLKDGMTSEIPKGKKKEKVAAELDGVVVGQN